MVYDVMSQHTSTRWSQYGRWSMMWCHSIPLQCTPAFFDCVTCTLVLALILYISIPQVGKTKQVRCVWVCVRVCSYLCLLVQFTYLGFECCWVRHLVCRGFHSLTACRKNECLCTWLYGCGGINDLLWRFLVKLVTGCRRF